MCTATFLPLSKNSFILTHNRDEHIGRKLAAIPKIYDIKDAKILYPTDTHANGTWIVTSTNNYTLCLLNGGFIKHESKPPYRLSRGKVVLDFFDFNNVASFIANYNFAGIEPFTLILIESKDQIILHEIVWDGCQIHANLLDAATPKIWCSTTLYSLGQRNQRTKWFTNWLENRCANYVLTNCADIITFHKNKPDIKLEGFLIEREDNKITVSISCVFKTIDQVQMIYEDLIQKTKNTILL
jgi:hypothetical protein